MKQCIEICGDIFSKNGFLLFSQKYTHDFYLELEKLDSGNYKLCIESKSEATVSPDEKDLFNELLDCEFIAGRLHETQELRRAVSQGVMDAINRGKSAEQIVANL